MSKPDYSRTEKIALVKVLKEVMFADRVVHYTEILFLDTIKKDMDIDSSLVNETLELTLKTALETLSALTEDKKSDIVRMLSDMCMADGHFSDEEKTLLTEILAKAGMSLESA